jgi:hypothetical protein
MSQAAFPEPHHNPELRRRPRTRAAGAASLLLLILPLAALLPEPLAAQQVSRADSVATLIGKVVSAMTGGPLPGARVVMATSGFGAITDETGNFRIDKVPAGFVDTIKVSRIGYASQGVPLKLQAGATTHAVFMLSETVLQVAELHVDVKPSALRDPLNDFKRDRKTGMGYFVTPKMIEEINPSYTTDILRRVPGVTVGAQVNGKSEIHVVHSNLNCYPTLYLDGILWPRHYLEELPPRSILAMEVYRGTSEIPPQYMGYGRPDCGVIVVWIKQGNMADSLDAGGG